MTDKFYNSKYSLKLYELNEDLDFFVKLYKKEKFPKVLMLSGKKGIGKSTIINHFLNFVYDEKNYNLTKTTISENSSFNKQYIANSFSNIIYLSGDNYQKIKIDDIRSLKSQLLKTTLLNKKRFIILDDVELFNINSLNALLKIIEEPTINNFFILINNKTKNLIETIYSRSLEYKINLKNEKRIKIITALIKENDLDSLIDYRTLNISPGNFLSFNDIMRINEINLDGNYLNNIEKIINIYKKNKDIKLINLVLLLTDFYFFNLKLKNTQNIDKIIENKTFVINNINKFIIYNINQHALINALNNKLSNG